MQGTIRGHRATVWRGEDVLVFLLHTLENLNRASSYRDIAVGVFRFQRGLYDLSILTEDLSPDADNTFAQGNVAPFQPQQLPTPESQLRGRCNTAQTRRCAGFPQRKCRDSLVEGFSFPFAPALEEHSLS